MIDKHTKHYWDHDYIKYWRDRVAESGAGLSSVIVGDSKTEDDEVYRRLFEKHPFKAGSVLDIGCAWGRFFPLFKAQCLRVSGVDISHIMVQAANDVWKMDDDIDCLIEAGAEYLPFSNNSFDNLVCIATFDATDQTKTLTEFFRVTRPGALLFITGKNHRYYTDDELAYQAECGARRKGHPNHFTDVASLLSQLKGGGAQVIDSYYFARRGDFADFKYDTDVNEPFYEYLLVIERGREAITFSDIGSQHSLVHKMRECLNE